MLRGTRTFPGDLLFREGAPLMPGISITSALKPPALASVKILGEKRVRSQPERFSLDKRVLLLKPPGEHIRILNRQGCIPEEFSLFLRFFKKARWNSEDIILISL